MQNLRELAAIAVPAGRLIDTGFLPALIANIPGAVIRREHLRDRRDPSLTQAAAADNELVEPVQQAVVDVVFAVHCHGHVLTAGAAENQPRHEILAELLTGRHFRCDALRILRHLIMAALPPPTRIANAC